MGEEEAGGKRGEVVKAAAFTLVPRFCVAPPARCTYIHVHTHPALHTRGRSITPPRSAKCIGRRSDSAESCLPSALLPPSSLLATFSGACSPAGFPGDGAVNLEASAPESC